MVETEAIWKDWDASKLPHCGNGFAHLVLLHISSCTNLYNM